MAHLRPYAPYGAKCGELIRLEHRDHETVGRRKLKGGVAKTVEPADSGYCENDGLCTVKLTNNIRLVTCGRHGVIRR